MKWISGAICKWICEHRPTRGRGVHGRRLVPAIEQVEDRIVPAFSVVNADVFGGASLRLVVDFNQSVNAGTVQAGDVLVDGSQPATSVNVLDVDSVEFVLPALSAGTHSLAIAAGAINDAGGTPVDPFSRSVVIASAAQFIVNHNPRLQPGNAPLVGYAGSSLDRVDLLWQTVSGGAGTQDAFNVDYRAVGAGAWQTASLNAAINTGVGGRVVRSATITGLAWNSDFEYRVRHLQADVIVGQYQSTFHTRLQAGDQSSFSFAAYGDSASGSATGFRQVQGRINQSDAAFAVLLGDNVYDAGSHLESDARFDPDINPEAAAWMAGHIDYLGLGNHDIGTSSGLPSEQNYSVPIPVAGVTAPAAPPASERAEHNHSWDYGDVHFITFDTNSLSDATRLDGLLNWVVTDLNASTARWKIVYGHHPVAGVPDKPESAADNYYQQVVNRLKAAGADLFMTGHSHTYAWTYPLTGQINGTATYVNHGADDQFIAGEGLPQLVSGLGGKEIRDGDFTQFPFVAEGFTSTTAVPARLGFSLVDVTHDQLTVSYVAADNGAVMDSFTISKDDAVQTATFQQGVNGYAGTVDTFLHENTPTTSNASATSLKVDNDDPAGTGRDAQALLRFNNLFGSSAGQIPTNAILRSATLQLQVTNTGNSMNLHRMLTNWAATDTWNTLVSGVQANGVEAVAAPDTSTGTVPLNLLSFNVLSSLQTWQASPATNLGWAFLPTGSDGVDFNSSEGGIKPKLIVNYVLPAVNEAPTSVSFTSTTTSIAENTAVSSDLKVADIVVTDDGLGSNVLSLSGADAASFTITGTSLFLKAGASLNFEGKPTYSVTVNVDDTTVGGTPDAFAVFTLNVTDVNEAPTSVSFTGTTTSIAENTIVASDLKVADIVVADDALGTRPLSLSGADAVSFTITGTSLFLKAGTALNFEGKPAYSVTVNVDDPSVGGTPDAFAVFTLNVTDVNEAPTSVSFTGTITSIAENTTVSSDLKVADIVVADDALGSRPLSLSGADAASFTISGTSLFLKAGTVLNFEGKPAYSVTVNVDDPSVGGTPDAFAVFTLNVTDVNEAPTSVSFTGTTTSIAENTTVASDLKVADIVVADDALGSRPLSLSGADAAAFTISGTSLFLKAGTALNFEAQFTYSVTVSVDDPTVGGTPDAFAVFTLNVTDVNEAPTSVSFTSTITSIAENTTVSSDLRVADIVVADDAPGSRPLSLSGADAASFTISGTSLFLKAGTALNFVTKPTYIVTVGVDDPTVGGTPDAFAVFTLNVTEANEAPTSVSFTSTTTSIAENTTVSPDLKVADIVVTDDGLGSNVLSLSGADAASFTISGASLFLKAGTALNFEAKPTYVVTVNVDDPTVGSTPDAFAVFTLNVTDVNEAPTSVSFTGTTTSIAENTSVSLDLKVADIVVADDAPGSRPLSLSGADAASFTISGTSLFLKAGTALNFEDQFTYSVTVNVDDPTVGGTPDAFAVFTLNVTDVNEAPTSVSFTGTTTSIAENTIVSSDLKVADIVVADDALGSRPLSLSGADAASFTISGASLFLKAATSLDFEAKPTYSVTVRVDDPSVGGTPDAFAVFTLNVVGANDNSPVFTSPTAFVAAENAIAVGTAAATDGDMPAQTVTFTITGGADAGRFNITSNGVLTFLAAPNFENPQDANFNNTYDVELTASDGAGRTTSQTVSVQVTNIAETPAFSSPNRQYRVDSASDVFDGIFSAGQLTLREAIELANTNPGSDTITFVAGLGPIDLTLGTLAVTDLTGVTTILGPSTNTQVIRRASGAGNFGVLRINPGVSASLVGLTLSGGAVGSADTGGGLDNWGAATLTNSTVSGNAGGLGGGVRNQSGSLTISGSTISGNTAREGGGVWSQAPLTIDNVTVSGNSAINQGGGLRIVSGGTLTAVNATIVGNRANSDNTGSETGGGLSLVSTGNSLANTIVAGNTRTGNVPDDITLSGGSFNAAATRNNLIADAVSSGGISNGASGNIVGNAGGGTRALATIVSPSLAANGGATLTHSLVQNSLAIGAGSTSVAGFRAYDQRETPRDPGAPDIGAYETQHPLSPVGTPSTYARTFLPKPSADANTAFIKGLYQSTLLREADPAGLSGWLAVMAGGATRAQIADGFVNSTENRSNQVTFFYKYFLGRSPDPAGLSGWVGILQSGVDEGTVMSGFLLSPEFTGQNDNASFVNLMYYAVLGRQAEPAGFAGWTSQLDSGQSTREQVGNGFLRSVESINRVVNSYFSSYLKRPADTGSSTAYLVQVQAGVTFGKVATSLLASDEFYVAAGLNL